MSTASQLTRPVGALLREWRDRRRLSQLALAVRAEISTRHLSFVETGRSQPSRDMVLHLAQALELPLRARNHLLLAAGYAPVYPESPLEAPHMTAVRAAVSQILHAHEPNPAVVVDRGWYLVDANPSLALLTEGVRPDLLAPPANVLRASLHPEGLAPRITNLGEWRAHLLSRLRRQVALTGDPGLTELHEELLGYPCADPEPEVELPGPGEVVTPLRVRQDGRELAFFSMVATFGTPADVTVSELAIESFFPADPATAEYLRQRG
ncbi:transcriptional regulator with XRE-family HTH domain [Crossiella equi]|uniref:Transcriptional regulator with XRE-family HTH domain n=1 Tax=Crossiella equi TaxID=130796 RepID=A0ABS5A4G8_9PSEU|nr:helix-turn-helix transcriptional regulator [Crossiella equi]MBP2471468.1 transcriptional regulator with XRE-family HTH domain [Crossiella equi]